MSISRDRYFRSRDILSHGARYCQLEIKASTIARPTSATTTTNGTLSSAHTTAAIATSSARTASQTTLRAHDHNLRNTLKTSGGVLLRATAEARSHRVPQSLPGPLAKLEATYKAKSLPAPTAKARGAKTPRARQHCDYSYRIGYQFPSCPCKDSDRYRCPEQPANRPTQALRPRKLHDALTIRMSRIARMPRQ